MQKIKTGDKVKVMRGKDAGVVSDVMKVVRIEKRPGVSHTRVFVRGVNKVKKHQKPNPSLNIVGGILEIEKPIDISNVMLVDPKDSKKVTRVGITTDKQNKQVRVAKKSNTNI